MEYINKYCKNTRYLCDNCDKIFNSISQFTIHHIHKHGHEKDEISLDCANCYQSFTDQFHFEKHLVHAENSLQKNDENNLNSLNIVDTFHELKVNYFCELCQRTFESKDLLNEHTYLEHENSLNHQIVIKHLRKIHFSLERELSRKKSEKLIQIKGLEVSTGRENQTTENERNELPEISQHIIQQQVQEKFKENFDLEVYSSLERELNLNKDEFAENEKNISTDEKLLVIKEVINQQLNSEILEEDLDIENVQNIDTIDVLSSESDTDYDSFLKINSGINQHTTTKETDGVALLEVNTIHILEKYKKIEISTSDASSGNATNEEVENHQEDHKCESCGKAFSRSDHLKRHIKTIHEGHRNYKCNSCGKSFTQSDHLKYHIKKIHEEQRHQCDSSDILIE